MRALISVSDKTGIVEFGEKLKDLGIDIISTGGTAKALKDSGVEVIGISEVTEFPECLNGRVKTLHPNIHAGLLAVRSNPNHMKQIDELGIKPIDIVVVNLYPFKETILKEGVTLEEAIENIDIGGPTMLRSAAKNSQDVIVIVDPKDYEIVLKEIAEGGVSQKTKFYLASKVFEHTAHYDAMIANYMREQREATDLPETLTLTFEKVQQMRYGENPHQNAAFYEEVTGKEGTLAAAKQIHGKALSYNNINDANGALELLKEFTEPTIIAAKHANPCGVGTGDTIYDAYMKAYNADPLSIFGGVVVSNTKIDKVTAEEMTKTFLEIIIAPEYDGDALEILQTKKNLRILELDNMDYVNQSAYDMKKVGGGMIVQNKDLVLFNDKEDLKVVTDRQPTEKEMEDLLFAWKIVKHVKSNGIALAKDGQSVGLGGGQTNRIWAANQSIDHGIEFLGKEGVMGSVLASDAFFPFSDVVISAAAAGIKAIIQPGGSIKDQESIDACNQHGITMVFTGMRHFKH
ncbi:MAG TPA: bifunctional phosphoribosylaminoimidazolecarboxamide formyltransferase/IMP cyclohydrolase [Epulopiscium sp.]|nr:bifunctional phosphoribosylaminoimidazolecarboxamide formyltransferase/IMP cyclohydrolase [Candidatus Epulonipiscium sp.]